VADHAGHEDLQDLPTCSTAACNVTLSVVCRLYATEP